MKRKFFASVLALVLAGTMVSCQSASSTPQSQSGSSKPASQGTDANDQGLTGTIEYWSSWNETEPQADAIQRTADAFCKENPNVKINITWNGRDSRKLIIPALESGTKIDLFDHNADTVTSLWSDYILNLDSFYDESYPTTEGKAYKDYILPSFVTLAETLGNGSKYVLPYAPQALLFMYNKDIFTAAKIEKAPESWEDLVAACEKIKLAGYIPLTTDDGYGANIYGYYLSKLKGDDWVFKLVNDTTKKMWDDPACLEAAKAIEELGKKGYYAPNVASNKFPAAQQEMVIDEKIAIYLNGTWLPNEVKDTARADFNWGQFDLKTVPNGIDGAEAGPYGCTGLAINKNSDADTAKAAFAFGVYLTTGEWDKEFSKVANAIPMTPSNEWPSVLQDASKIIPNYTKRYYSQTAIRMNNDVLPIIQPAVINLAAGKMTAEQFIAEMKK